MSRNSIKKKVKVEYEGTTYDILLWVSGQWLSVYVDDVEVSGSFEMNKPRTDDEILSHVRGRIKKHIHMQENMKKISRIDTIKL